MPLTIASIAEAAGVSPATVDRALNQRSGVHARTRARVLHAAQRLGYVDGGSAGALPAPVCLAFVVPGGGNTFLGNLSRALEAAGRAAPGVSVRVHRLDTYRPEALADGLHRVAAEADAVGVVALDHPAVRAAIRALAARRVRVLTLVSDISDVPRLAYVGIDNRAAGRLAAHLVGRFVRAPSGPVALFAGSLRYRGHEEREMGFRGLCAEDFPGLVPLPTVEMEDDTERAYLAARRLLAENPELRAIYCLGGGVRGIARALEEGGGAGRIVFVGHELTEHTARLLVAGTIDAVIDQDAATEARLAVAHLAAAARGEDPPPARLLRTQAVFRENIPDFADHSPEPGDAT